MMRLQGTLKDLAGEGLLGFLMLQEKRLWKASNIIKTFDGLCKTGDKELPLPSTNLHLPVSAWNIYLSAVFRLHTQTLEFFKWRRHGLKVLQELEASGKSDLETSAMLLDVALADARNWRMLKNGRDGVVPFGEEIFSLAKERTAAESSPKTVIRLWRGRLKLSARLASDEAAVRLLLEAKTKCPYLFEDGESVVELAQFAVFSRKSDFLRELFGSLKRETVFPLVSLHRLFCSPALMSGSEATELVMRWMKVQKVFNNGSLLWDEAAALRVLEWTRVRMMMRGANEQLAESLALSALQKLSANGRVLQEHLEFFFKIAFKLKAPSAVTQSLIAKYSVVKNPLANLLD